MKIEHKFSFFIFQLSEKMNDPNIIYMYTNFWTAVTWTCFDQRYLTIIPRARMGSESMAHEAEGRMGYWLRGHEGERNNCFSKIQLVGQKYREWKNCS